MNNKTKEEQVKNTLKRRVKIAQPEQEKLYAFKVMRRMENGDLHSASVPLQSRLHKVYHQGQKTEVSVDLFSQGYGICCFRTLEEARGFRGVNSGRREIWKVEVGQLIEPAEKRPSIEELDGILPKGSKDNFRRVISKIKAHLNRDSWPSGTMMADFVIPVEKVYPLGD